MTTENVYNSGMTNSEILSYLPDKEIIAMEPEDIKRHLICPRCGEKYFSQALVDKIKNTGKDKEAKINKDLLYMSYKTTVISGHDMFRKQKKYATITLENQYIMEVYRRSKAHYDYMTEMAELENPKETTLESELTGTIDKQKTAEEIRAKYYKKDNKPRCVMDYPVEPTMKECFCKIDFYNASYELEDYVGRYKKGVLKTICLHCGENYEIEFYFREHNLSCLMWDFMLGNRVDF